MSEAGCVIHPQVVHRFHRLRMMWREAVSRRNPTRILDPALTNLFQCIDLILLSLIHIVNQNFLGQTSSEDVND